MKRIETYGIVLTVVAVLALSGCESDIFPSVVGDIAADSATGGEPEFVLKQGLTGLADGETFDYGAVQIGTPRDVSFTIENRGGQELRLTGVSEVELSGAGAYSVVTPPASAIPPGSESVFTVRLSTTTAGETYEATATIQSNAEEEAFELDLTGTGVSGTSPGGSIQIGPGDPNHVNSDRQALYLTVFDDVSGPADIEMMVSNNSDFSGAGWVTYSSFIPDWAMANPSVDGVKRVYVRFRDEDGNESVPFSDSTYLDTTGPTGTIQIADGDRYETDASTSLQLTGTDSGGSGGVQMRVANGPDPSGASSEPVISSKSWTLTSGFGEKTVSVQFVDALGNLSTVVTDTILVDDIYEGTWGNNWWDDAYDLYSTFPGVDSPSGGVDDRYGSFSSQYYHGSAVQGDDDWYRIYAVDGEEPVVQVNRPGGASGNFRLWVYRVDSNDIVNQVASSGWTQEPFVSWTAGPGDFLDPGYYYIRVEGADQYEEYGLSWADGAR